MRPVPCRIIAQVAVKLSLTLLELGIFFVNDVDLSFSPHDYTINGTFFDGRSDFHVYHVLQVSGQKA